MKNKMMKQLRRNLALLLCGAMLLSSTGMVSAEESLSQRTDAPAGRNVTDGDSGSDAQSVTLKVLDIKGGQSLISDTVREMPQQYMQDTSAVLAEGRVLPADLNEKAPDVAGWRFVAWYTAPVRYAFWGDKTNSTWQAEPLPFTEDCNGQKYDFKVNKEEYPDASHSMTGYWYWLSTLQGEGRKVEPGDTLAENETALYALYEPTEIHYTLNYSGWGRKTGVMSCSRQYGTPFGNDDVDKNGWSGFEFDGWYSEDGTGPMTFYDIPVDGTCYVAHWHSTDGRGVTWENYRELGYSEVNRLTMKDGTLGSGARDLGDTLLLHSCAQNSKTISVEVGPADCGVTKLKWEVTGDRDAVRVEVLDDGLRATVSATGKAGKAIVTVRSGNGCSDSVTVDTGGHAFDKSELIQQGNCVIPTRVRYTCVYCGKVEVRETYSQHKYAYRDAPATCTEPHKWVHYCKVCGLLDPQGDMIRGQAKGHDFKTFIATGCSGTTTTKVCQTCGYTEVSSDPSAASHNWASYYTVDKRPTCQDEGSQSIKCLSCGATKPDSSVVIPADPSLHAWSAWVVETEATDTTEGQRSRTCSVCGVKEIRTIPPTSYTVDSSAIIDGMMLSGSYWIADRPQADAAIKKTVDKLLGNGSILGEDILFAAIRQQGISTEISVMSVAAPENDSDADKFNAILGSGSKVFYMDIDILVKAGGENIGRITETEESMTFNAQLPEGGRIIRVLRAHEGRVEAIPCWVEGNTVYFMTDKFSTFAVCASNDISQATAEAIPDQTRTGSEIRPSVKLTINGGQTLTEGVDYSLSYSNNVETGTASVIITGMGSFAGSSKKVDFNIVSRGSGNAGRGGSGNSSASSAVWNSRVDVDWNAVASALDAAGRGSDVNVSTGTEFVIPVSVQERVWKDKATLACQAAGTDITFTLSTRDMKRPKKDMALSVSNQADIPAAVSREVTDTAVFSRVLNIGPKSLFPQKINMHMVLGEQYAGRLAVMYSYDEITGKMRYENSFRITENGLALFPLLRGDEYVIVVTDQAAGYRVLPGDTLSGIAAKNGVTLRALRKANPQIRNADRIYVGETLVIPGR